MKWLDATLYIDELELLNSQHDDRQIMAVVGSNNTMLVSYDLLQDCEKDNYWIDYKEWLNKLPITNEQPIPQIFID